METRVRYLGRAAAQSKLLDTPRVEMSGTEGSVTAVPGGVASSTDLVSS